MIKSQYALSMEEALSLWHCSLGLHLDFLCVLLSDGCVLGFPLEHPPLTTLSNLLLPQAVSCSFTSLFCTSAVAKAGLGFASLPQNIRRCPDNNVCPFIELEEKQ